MKLSWQFNINKLHQCIAPCHYWVTDLGKYFYWRAALTVSKQLCVCKNLDPYVSNIKALTCSDNQGGHKLHSYKACNLQQNLDVLVEFVKNDFRQMVRPQLPFCIPFKNDSQRFQRITSNLIFLQQVTKADFLCSKLQNFWRSKFSSNLR